MRKTLPKTVHMWDPRTTNRTLCGRSTEHVRWTAGYWDSGQTVRKVKVTCRACAKKQ
jgi:hypothetical protein